MEKTSDSLQADILVVGGGGAGLAAALTAAEEGAANVVLLEACNVPGGNFPFVEGIFAIDRKLQESADIQELKDRLVRSTMSYTQHRTDPGLLRMLIEESANTLRWLEGKGLRFEWRNTLHNGEIRLYASDIEAREKTGSAIIKALIKACEDAGVRILCRTRARKLLTNEAGKIAGLMAEVDGEELTISTGCVILASGGFAGNKELLRKHVPLFSDDIHIGGLPNRGDGMLMAAEVGANVDDTVALEMEGPAFVWNRDLPVLLTGHRWSVWVNRKGERFAEEIYEPFLSANSLNRQPGKVSYTLMDADIKNGAILEIAKKDGEVNTEQESGFAARMDNVIRMQVEKGRIKVAGSWDEIAEWMGARPETLKATIEQYNSCCSKGRDDLFAKDPANLLPLHRQPYYAFRCYPNLLVTHGGIKISLKMEALDKDDNPVPGLYAAGVDTGGVDSGTYYFSLTGHSSGFSLSTGRISGKEAAIYAAKK